MTQVFSALIETQGGRPRGRVAAGVKEERFA
jgi:hypothetical protein